MILQHPYDSPIGVLEISFYEEKITSISYKEKNYKEKYKVEAKKQNFNVNDFKINLEKKFTNNSIKNPIVAKTIQQLDEYFDGSRKKFDLPLSFTATNFEQKVYRELIRTPYGQTKTYGEIAEKCNSPKAARAVGNTCKKNKLLLLIPCHRIVGANQKLVGFSAGGVKNKDWLLNFEKKNLEKN